VINTPNVGRSALHLAELLVSELCEKGRTPAVGTCPLQQAYREQVQHLSQKRSHFKMLLQSVFLLVEGLDDSKDRAALFLLYGAGPS